MKYKLLSVFIFTTTLSFAQNKTVQNAAELQQAAKAAHPGDTIFLANKEWKDASLIIQSKGSKEHPVVIMPQTIGGIFFSGKSDLRIGGEYIVMYGFYFKSGYSPRKAVVEFRIDDNTLANNCRLTQCVIEDYSQPGRFDNDNWIVLWGKNNRVDHCTFTDKLNSGPVLIAELNDERSQNNYHSVDSNYFKGRQRFGSNGGETIRIGVSRYSLTASHTQIVNNYFEKCNGEVEIVSIKSGNNNVSNNTFFECEGGLVLRHGSGNIVNGNLFLGNNKPFTGGVRIINPGHTVTNNIFKELAGTGFRSALSVLNGVPNSLINRYYQTTDVNIANNTFIDCASILFGAGKDAERTLSPQRILFQKNLFVKPPPGVYTDDNQDGGIIFSNNAISANDVGMMPKGFVKTTIKNLSKDGHSFPFSNSYGAVIAQLSFIDNKSAGANWWMPKKTEKNDSNVVYRVSMNDAPKMHEIVKKAKAGTIIELCESGMYKLEKAIVIDKPITIRAAAGLQQKPVLVNVSYKTLPAFMVIENGGSLLVKGISFNGAYESFGNVEAGIKSTNNPMNQHYNLTIDGCAFYNYNEGSYAGFKAEKSTFADSVIIINSLFRNISGTAINMAEEKEDKGIYGVDNTLIKNCVFTNILGAAINLYRGGNDESTTGPAIAIDHCTFNEVENREQGTSVRLVGAQYATITNSIFNSCGRGGRSIEFREYRWDKIKVDYCNFYQSGRVASFYNKVMGKNIYLVNPGFVNPEKLNFNLKNTSPLLKKSSDEKALGASL